MAGLTPPGVSGKGFPWRSLVRADRGRGRGHRRGQRLAGRESAYGHLRRRDLRLPGRVGVTDGSYVFAPPLAAIEKTIKNQDANAQKTGDYVSIALLTPLTSAPGSDVTLSRIQQQMEGAATAQAYLNRQDFKPAIRLLLANEGSQQQAWPQVVRQLQDWPADQNLVAVVGVGLSTTDTVQAARQLASGTIPLPMIGSIDTGDGLNTSGPQPPLVPPGIQRADQRPRARGAKCRRRG